ncbi:MAG: FHA domain-containing protein, partial [Chitinivibrionales bacterium]|nr:FHA domain-containing protein [Chitinivibrionales bacterium]
MCSLLEENERQEFCSCSAQDRLTDDSFFAFPCFLLKNTSMEWNIEIEDMRIHETQRHTHKKPRLTIGRSNVNDIVILNSYISREHLILSIQDASCSIQDLGSVNGTFLEKNNEWEKITGTTTVSPPTRLLLGEEISLRIQLQAPAPSNAETAALTLAHPKPSMAQVFSIK